MDNGAYLVKSTLPTATMYYFNTLCVCYSHIEDVHEEVY